MQNNLEHTHTYTYIYVYIIEGWKWVLVRLVNIFIIIKRYDDWFKEDDDRSGLVVGGSWMSAPI